MAKKTVEQEELKKSKLDEKLKTNKLEVDNNDGNALDGYSSIREWEDKKGRGFWGSSSNGYISYEDRDNE